MASSSQPIITLCSPDLSCRRSFLLKYLETGDSTPSGDGVPFQGCCDLCDHRLGELEAQNTKPPPKESNAALRTISQVDTDRLDKVLRTLRLDMCRELGEMAPYKLLTSDEIKSLSSLRPTSLSELRSHFQWSEERLSLIGESIVSCILADSKAHNIVNSSILSTQKILINERRSEVPEKRPIEEISLETPPLQTTADPVVEKTSLPEKAFSLPTTAIMKRRRSEAVNASCGVGKSIFLIKLTFHSEKK